MFTNLVFRCFKMALLGLAITLLFRVNVHAQQYLGKISGEVTDASGAIIPNAAVSVIDGTTRFITHGKTNDAGLYSIPFLQPGTYSVRVETDAFAPNERTGVLVHAGDNQQVNFSMSVGQSVESVQVTADRQALETGTATISDTISVKEVTDLPNIGRNPLNVDTLSPGVYNAIYGQAKASASTQPFGSVSASSYTNGISARGRVIINGIPDDPPERTSGQYTGFAPSPEAVQEVTTQTAIYDAQYGHSAGTFTNTVLRTGSNSYHGAAYYVFQNTYLNANTYERVAAKLPRANDQWNQPGFVVDGPISIPHLYNGHDKSFFMVAVERIQNDLPTFFTGTVPTAKMRTGDFSELLNPAGGCTGAYVCIYDPSTNTGSGNRLPFANNNLTAKLNPVGKALLNIYPLPNAQGTGLAGLTNNYVAKDVTTKDYYYSVAVRVDHQIRSNIKLNAAYIRSRRNQIFSNAGFPSGGGPGYIHTRNNDGGSLDVVTILSPKLVLDSRVGLLYHPFTLTADGYHYDLASLGFPPSLISQLPLSSFPAVTVSDGVNSLTSGQSQYTGTTMLAANELLSQSLGRHSLKYGIDYQLVRFNTNLPTSGLGTFGFDREFTQQNGLAGAGTQTNSGFGLASVALGYASSGAQSTNASSAYQQHYFGLFVQDDWKVTNRLTLNLGLRWDFEQPWTERHDAANAGFCFTCVSPLQASGLPTLMGGLLFADPSHRYPYKRDRDNFQPRIGAAFQLNHIQVLRGGFAITYIGTTDFPGSIGFSTTTPYSATVDGTTPYTSLSNPYPDGLNVPHGRQDGLLTQLGAAISFQNRDHVIPRLFEPSLTLQTQLPGEVLVELGFVANLARDIQLSKNINTLPQSYFSLGAAALQNVVLNPLAGKLPSNSTLNAPMIQQQYLLLPYPQFGSVTESSIPAGMTNYISMQNRVSKRMSTNLSLHASFTWAKVMTNNYLNAGDQRPTYFQDSQPNLFFNMTALYKLPRFQQIGRLTRLFIGNWQANLVFRKQNGIAVSNPTNVIPLQDPGHGVQQSYARMFNPCYLTATGAVGNAASLGCQAANAAFQQEANPSFVVQSIHPYMDHVRNKIKPRADFSLFKKFDVHEGLTFEIRGEFFNIFNSVNFVAPNTTITAATFGTVPLTQSNDARIGQLTARLNF